MVRRDHLDTHLLELCVEWIAVVRLVTDEAFRELL